MKNLSIQQLAAFAAAIIALGFSLTIGFIYHSWLRFSVTFLCSWIISYLLIRYVFEIFVNRKIKLIYKLIYQTKATKREETYFKYILPKKELDEVGDEVVQWAEQRSAEIEQLKTNENYRKEFLQNLSHEIKTPIFAIQGYVDTLLDGALENPETAVRFLKNASKNVDRMVNLVKDLDEIAKLEMGEQPLNQEVFFIQDIIKEVFDALSIKAAKQNITCSFKKGSEGQTSVFADKEKIRQVLNNLVVNASKYGKQDGSIVASVYKTDEDHVLIEISDDGIGIAEEHLPRIFERFYRTDKGRSRDAGGAGIGLAICKHIIEAHGQTIHVRSKLEIGTTIGFTLATNA
jgi:two-component system phosphate regulon sensor histidine kinase PhoR